MFKLDGTKVCKFQQKMERRETIAAVLEDLAKSGLMGACPDVDPSEVISTYNLGGGVAVMMLDYSFCHLASRNDFKIYYFVRGFGQEDGSTVNVAICFVSKSPTHERNFERIAKVVFNMGDGVFFDTERTVEEICSWVMGESRVGKYISIMQPKVPVVAANIEVGNAAEVLQNAFPEIIQDSDMIISPVLLSDSVMCEVRFNFNADCTVLAPVVFEHDGRKGVVLLVVAGRDGLYLSLLNTLSVAASYDRKSMIGVSRETLQKYLSDLPFKITPSDRNRLIKLREVASPDDEWHQIVISIINEHGLHARPAAVLSKIARMFKCPVWIRRENDSVSSPVNAKDFMQIVTMNIECGDRVVVSSSGDNSGRALELIAEAAEQGFTGEFYQKVLGRLKFTLDDD